MSVENGNEKVIHQNGIEIRCQNALIGDIYVTQEVKSNDEEYLRIREDISTKLRSQYANIELPRVPWLGNLDLPLEDLYVKGVMTEITKTTNNKLQETNTDITDLFTDNTCYRIYVKGAPGFGKTCLIYKLAFDWSKREKYLSRFDLVFVIELRYLTLPIDQVITMLAKVDGLSDDVIMSAILMKRKEILLLLDGYDELSESDRHFVIPLLTSAKLPQVTVLVTSREGLFTSSKDCFWNKQICLRGIQFDEQKSFLRGYFDSDDEAEKIVCEIHRIGHRNMETLFCCPLFLILLAFVVSENSDIENGGIVLPKNKTQLYKKIFNYLIRRSLNRERMTSQSKTIVEDAISTTTDNCYVELLKNFGEFALKALQQSRFSFTEDEILRHCNNNKDVFRLGFLRKMSKLQKRTPIVYYEAIHTTFLEFLAAFYLQNSSEDELSLIIVNLFHRWDSTLIFNFLVGLMADNCHQFFKILANFTGGSIYFPFYLELFSEIKDHCYQSIPKILAPFLPSKWHMSWERHKNGFSRTLFHSQMVENGVQCGAITAVHYKESFVVNMPSGVKYPCIVVNVGLSNDIQTETQENLNKLAEIQCFDLVLYNIRNNDVGTLFLNNVKSDNVCIKLDSSNQALFLEETSVKQCGDRVKWLAINNVTVKEWDLVCDIVAPKLSILKLGVKDNVDLGKLNNNALFDNLNHLDLSLGFDINNADVDALISSITNMQNLDEISLMFKRETNPTIDLSYLCNNRKSPLLKLKLVNADLSVTKPVRIEHFIVENVTSISTIMSCDIDVLQCSTELLQQLLTPNNSHPDNCLAQTLEHLTTTLSPSHDIVEFNNQLHCLKQLNFIIEQNISINEQFLNNLQLLLPKNHILNISIVVTCTNNDSTIVILMKWLQSLQNENLKITFTVKFAFPLESDTNNEELELLNLIKQCLISKHIHQIHFKIAPHRNTPSGLSLIFKLFPTDLFNMKFLKSHENTIEKTMNYAFSNVEKDDDTWIISLLNPIII